MKIKKSSYADLRCS